MQPSQYMMYLRAHFYDFMKTLRTTPAPVGHAYAEDGTPPPPIPMVMHNLRAVMDSVKHEHQLPYNTLNRYNAQIDAYNKRLKAYRQQQQNTPPPEPPTQSERAVVEAILNYGERCMDITFEDKKLLYAFIKKSAAAGLRHDKLSIRAELFMANLFDYNRRQQKSHSEPAINENCPMLLPEVVVTASRSGDELDNIVKEKSRPKADNTGVGRPSTPNIEKVAPDQKDSTTTELSKWKNYFDLTDVLFAELGFTHYLPKKLIYHYGTYSGKTYKLSAQEMKDVNPIKFGIEKLENFNNLLTQIPLGESVRIKEGYINDRGANTNGTLGTFAAVVNGTLTKKEQGYTFKGTMRFEDFYDFDSQENGKDSKRSKTGEMKTTWGRNLLGGIPFSITSEEVPVSQAVGEGYFDWFADVSQDYVGDNDVKTKKELNSLE